MDDENKQQDIQEIKTDADKLDAKLNEATEKKDLPRLLEILKEAITLADKAYEKGYIKE